MDFHLVGHVVDLVLNDLVVLGLDTEPAFVL
jgi:hypothetical protein